MLRTAIILTALFLALPTTPARADDKERILDLLRKKRGGDEAAPAASGEQRSARDEFSISATYVGGVKKSFKRIGYGKVVYTDLGSDRFGIRAKAEIRHPDKDETYRFELDLTFQMSGNRIQLVKNGSQFNEASAGYRGRIESAAPFLYLTKALPAPAAGESRTFLYQGKSYEIRYESSGRATEATIYEGDEPLSTAFITGQTPEGFNNFERFRVPDKELVISFVTREPGSSESEP